MIPHEVVVALSNKNPNLYYFTKEELLALHDYLGGLGGICQRLGLSGIGSRDELITRIMTHQAGMGR